MCVSERETDRYQCVNVTPLRYPTYYLMPTFNDKTAELLEKYFPKCLAKICPWKGSHEQKHSTGQKFGTSRQRDHGTRHK